jgi:hypothetical protein
VIQWYRSDGDKTTLDIYVYLHTGGDVVKELYLIDVNLNANIRSNDSD